MLSLACQHRHPIAHPAQLPFRAQPASMRTGRESGAIKDGLMKGARLFLASRCMVLVVLLAGAIVTASASEYETRTPSPSLQIEAKMREAVRGDAGAAYDLWWYFSIDMNDPKEAHFWLKLSAEQGLCEAEFQYAYELVFIYEDLNKAAHWLRKFEATSCPELPKRANRVARLWKRIESRTTRAP
jgi:hypothetical protein